MMRTQHPTGRRLFFSLLLSLGTAGLVQAQSLALAQIVERHVQALGGADQLRSVQTLQMEAETKVMVFMTARVQTTAVHGEGFQMVIKLGNDEVSRSIANPQGKGVTLEEGKRTPLDPREARGLFNAADLSGPFVDSAKKGVTLKLLPEQILKRGLKAYVIEVDRGQGDPVSRHFIRADTFMLARVEEKSYSTENQKWEDEWSEYDDYRTVGGVQLPHRLRTQEGELKVTSYRVNQLVDKKVFALQ
jgi:hypothetical protein